MGTQCLSFSLEEAGNYGVENNQTESKDAACPLKSFQFTERVTMSALFQDKIWNR